MFLHEVACSKEAEMPKQEKLHYFFTASVGIGDV